MKVEAQRNSHRMSVIMNHPSSARQIEAPTKFIDNCNLMKMIHDDLGFTLLCFHTSGGGLRVLMT